MEETDNTLIFRKNHQKEQAMNIFSKYQPVNDDTVLPSVERKAQAEGTSDDKKGYDVTVNLLGNHRCHK